MEKVYYTIGEVAEALGENVPLVRFWSNSFPTFIRPVRNAKGNRLFTRADLDTFRQIHFGEGMRYDSGRGCKADEGGQAACRVQSQGH